MAVIITYFVKSTAAAAKRVRGGRGEGGLTDGGNRSDDLSQFQFLRPENRARSVWPRTARRRCEDARRGS